MDKITNLLTDLLLPRRAVPRCRSPPADPSDTSLLQHMRSVSATGTMTSCSLRRLQEACPCQSFVSTTSASPLTGTRQGLIKVSTIPLE